MEGTGSLNGLHNQFKTPTLLFLNRHNHPRERSPRAVLESRMTYASLSRCLGLLSICAPLCSQPILERMQPRGAEAGTAARLLLSGKRLGPTPRIISEAGFAATPLTGSMASGQTPPSELVYLIEVGAEAVPGIYPLRLETAEGLSNALLFTVGKFPQIVEHESEANPEGEQVANDYRETAQAIEAPVTVEGRLQGPDRDIYSIEAKAGQNVVVEVAARRVGSAIDPNLELLDEEGTVIARNGDAPGLGLDSRLAVQVPADGEYFISVRDERFSEQVQDFYRLTVGDYRFAGSVFPLGWTRGSEVRAEFFGGNLVEPLHAEVDIGRRSGNAGETWIRVPGTPASLPFLLSDDTETLEADADGIVRDGVVVNGRIAATGETDRYRLAVQGGEQWAFELRSGELPGSSLYGVMTVSSENDTLAVAGKHAGDPNPYVISTTGQTATYPFVNLTIPPDVNEITLSVEDLLGRGGPEHSYRLVARKQGPDFLLSLVNPQLNIPQNGSTVLTVIAERRGYYGPIQVYLDNAPADLEVSGGQIAPTSTLGNTRPRFEFGRLTVTAREDAELRRLNLVVRGRATEAGQEHLDRRATAPGIRVAVKGTQQGAVTAEWLSQDLPACITPEQPAFLAFEVPLKSRVVRGGQGLRVKWTYTARTAEAKVKKKVEIPRNFGSLRLRNLGDKDATESGEFLMFTHERTSLGMVNFNLSATVTGGGRDHQLTSKPLEVDVVDGYTLEAPSEPLVLVAGSEGPWQGEIWRDTEFRRTVDVSALGLPFGVECEPTGLENDQIRYELACTASPDAMAGEYQVEIKAESVLSDEGTTPIHRRSGQSNPHNPTLTAESD